MKTVADLEATIERRLARTWHTDIGDGTRNWPYRIPLGQPSSVELEQDFPSWSRNIATIRSWASRRDVTVEARDRRVHGTTQ